jgi:IS30 family transposase
MAMGMSQTTISRELARNPGLRSYRHKQDHDRAVMRRENVIRPIKMIAEMIASIDPMLRQDWSPEQVSGVLAGGCGSR